VCSKSNCRHGRLLSLGSSRPCSFPRARCSLHGGLLPTVNDSIYISRAKYDRRISMSCWSFSRSGEPCSWSGQRCFPSSRFLGLMTGTRSPWRQPVAFQQSSGNGQSVQRPPTKISPAAFFCRRKNSKCVPLCTSLPVSSGNSFALSVNSCARRRASTLCQSSFHRAKSTSLCCRVTLPTRKSIAHPPASQCGIRAALRRL
jgi:hypothetical protein